MAQERRNTRQAVRQPAIPLPRTTRRPARPLALAPLAQKFFHIWERKMLTVARREHILMVLVLPNTGSRSVSRLDGRNAECRLMRRR